MNKLLRFAILILLLAACSKSNTPAPAQSVTDTDPPQYGTPFAMVPDAKDVVMYEINLRAFSTQGNFAGVAVRLDSIKALGINVIWLMPIYPVGQVKSAGGLGSPYSVKNYKEVNSEFGTLDDLRNLVDQAHSKGMSVILDWVGNHTSWDNPWISNKSWYTQDASGNIIIPAGTNWQDVADLNYDNMDMRKAMINAIKYWVLAANVDGFRCDYADGIPFDFWKQAIDTLKAIPNHKLVLLAEGARSDHFTAGFQLNYAWDFYAASLGVFGQGQPASDLATANSSEQNVVPAGDFKLRFISNHDEDAWNNTPLVLFNGADGSIAAFVLAEYMGGVPLIYNGQEVGCSVKLPFFTRSPIDWTTHPEMTADYKKLVAFRKGSEAVKQGSIETYAHHDVVAFKRTYMAEEVLVLVNTRNTLVSYPLDAAVANTIWHDAMNNNAEVDLSTQLDLEPYAYRVLTK